MRVAWDAFGSAWQTQRRWRVDQPRAQAAPARPGTAAGSVLGALPSLGPRTNFPAGY